MDLNQALKDAKVNIDDLTPSLRALIGLLFNKIEELSEEVTALKMENQKLRDEVNRLKGEQGKPDIRPQTSSKDFSSEKERKDPLKKKQKKSKAKNHKITVNRTQRCPVDKSKLPADAVFKGLASVIVQDLIITPDNIEFEKEMSGKGLARCLLSTRFQPLPIGTVHEVFPHTARPIGFF